MLAAAAFGVGAALAFTDRPFLLPPVGYWRGLTLTKTDHVVGNEAIINFGFVLREGATRVYYMSDSRFIEPTLLGNDVLNPTVLIIPISDRGLVMGFDDALYFANEVKPKVVVPMHYNSPKDEPRVDPGDFVARGRALSSQLTHLSRIEFKILGIGEAFDVS